MAVTPTASKGSAAQGRSPQSSLDLLVHVSRELSSALDLRLVLEQVIKLCLQNVGGSSGTIIVLDDQGHPLDSIIVVKDKVIQEATEQLKFTLQDGLAGWVRKNREAALVRDTSADKRWQVPPSGKQSGPKSVVAAPLLVRESLVGILTLTHPDPGFFDEEQLSLVKIIGDQAAFAVLNARLYAESQRRAGVMTAIAESASAIGASLQLDQVLQTILEQTTHALEVEAVSLALTDPSGKGLVFRAATGQSSKQVVGLHLELGQGVAGWVAKEGKGVVVQDVAKDPRFTPKWITPPATKRRRSPVRPSGLAEK